MTFISNKTIEKIKASRGLFQIGDDVRLLDGNVTYTLESTIKIKGRDHDLFVVKNEKHNLQRLANYKNKYPYRDNYKDFHMVIWYDAIDIFCPIERLDFQVPYWMYKGQKYLNKTVADHMHKVHGGEAPVEFMTDRVDKLIISA